MNKRILVISKDQYEFSTEEVMDWLWWIGHSVTRINGDSFESIGEYVQIKQEKGDTSCSIGDLNLDDFDIVWLRRWSDAPWVKDFDVDIAFPVKHGLVTNIAKELGAVRGFLFHALESKMKLTNGKQLSLNKLIAFKEASLLGFNIPDYIITNRKEVVQGFLNSHKKVVCKDIDSPLLIQFSGEQALSYAELIDQDFIDNLPEEFMLSIFQAYIEKDFEIRTFVLGREIYSMAIFSQADTKTEIDFRKYNTSRPNRTVPYKLPIELETQILNLMGCLGLITGSIDLIRNKTGQFFFLEVNPVGQFGMVSQPCNYGLEEKIANFLTK